MVASLDLAAGSCLLVMGGLFTDRKKTGSLKMHRVVPVFSAVLQSSMFDANTYQCFKLIRIVRIKLYL